MNLFQHHLHCFVTPVARADQAACAGVLSGPELERAGAFRFDRDRQLSIIARAQVRYLLSAYTGESPEKICFSLGEKGKPMVRPGTAGEGICFNVSHARGLVVSVFSRRCEVGADVEGLDRKTDVDIARRFFKRVEFDQITALPKTDQHKAFLRFWTLKEAWAKALGQGLGAGLDRMGFDLSVPGSIGYTPDDPAQEGGWQFYQFEPAPGAMAALAAASCGPLSLSVYHCLPLDRIWPAQAGVTCSDRGLHRP